MSSQRSGPEAWQGGRGDMKTLGTWQPVDGPGARSGPWVHPADLLAHQLFHLQQSLS